jgi:hypothetical protein
LLDRVAWRAAREQRQPVACARHPDEQRSQLERKTLGAMVALERRKSRSRVKIVRTLY